ncbi:retropepsin-like aspartic protease family protein [Eionea flava]
MKWMFAICLISICLSVGYWLGSSNKSQQTPPTQTAEEKSTETQITKTLSQKIGIATAKQNQTKPSTAERSNQEFSSQPKTNFSKLLNDGMYKQAVNILYETPIDSTEHSNFKASYIDHILTLLSTPEQNKGRTSDALNTYLATFYDDTEALLLQSQQYVLLENFYEALITLQQANSYAYTNQKKSLITETYRKIINYIDTQLSNQKRNQELVTIYEYAGSLELLENKDIVRLAALYLRAGDKYLAKEQLSKLPNTPEWSAQAAAIFPKEENETSVQNNRENEDSKLSIPLKRVANQFIVSTKISSSSTQLLIDTGASLTTINKTHFNTIKRTSNLSFLRQQNFLTANGKTSGAVYTAKEFFIGEYLLENIEIAVLDFPTSSHSNGLLGMNVLQQFTFQIDQENAALILEKNTSR